MSTLTASTTRFVAATMTHRCTIERDESVGEDTYGGLPPAVWQEYLIDVPCFLYSTGNTDDGRESVQATGTAAIDELKLMLPIDTDVVPADRVRDVRTPTGDVVINGILNIRDVRQHHTHLELRVERVTGGV